MAVLCVDAGTTMVKAVLFDDDGRAIDVERQPAIVHRPGPGRSEQDMNEVWAAVIGTVRLLLARTARPVHLVSVTGQGDGCWLVDGAGRPTGPAVLWNDARAAGLVDRWQQEGRLERAYRRSGSLAFAGTSAAILAWLGEHDPERVARSATALHCEGWLFLRMTGARAIEESDAATSFLDVRARAYAPELLDEYGVGWAERLLPPVRGEDDRVETISLRAASELGLPPGLPVVLAPFDVPSTAIGVGSVRPGEACSILGTTLASGTVEATPDTSGTPAGMLLPSGVGSRLLRVMATMAGVEVLAWATRLLGLDDERRLPELAEHASPGSGGLVFLPYLSPAGERAPFRDSTVRGGFVGLSFEHGRAEVARAVLEGMSLVVRDCLDVGGTMPTQVRLCGGGAGSDVWRRLLADVLGVPVSRADDEEAGAKGAFVAAQVAVGDDPDVESAVARTVRTVAVSEPDPTRAAVYDTLYAEHHALLASSGGPWHRLASTRSHP